MWVNSDKRRHTISSILIVFSMLNVTAQSQDNVEPNITEVILNLEARFDARLENKYEKIVALLNNSLQDIDNKISLLNDALSNVCLGSINGKQINAENKNETRKSSTISNTVSTSRIYSEGDVNNITRTPSEGDINNPTTENYNSSTQKNDKCPMSQGFFRVQPGSHECYISFRDRWHRRTWTEAEEHCRKEGLQMVEQPTDPARLRKYLVETYDLTNGGDHWMGGRSSGSEAMKWQKSGDVLPDETSGLWFPGHGYVNKTAGECLLLGTFDDALENWPEQPYWSTWCGIKYHTLCQVIME